MAYSINPNLPKARAFAMKLLFVDELPVFIVANRSGVSRTTIWRWKKKWEDINNHPEFVNHNRPNRIYSRASHLLTRRWLIPTLSSRPNTSPSAVASHIIDRVLELRNTLKRCAEVIWYHLVTIDRITVSLSSVRRILKRYNAINGRRKRVRYDNPHRPVVTNPGELVQTDTIHYICPITKSRRYVYTVIDLYSRMTYAEIHNKILPGIAAKVVLRASSYFGYKFNMVQADNGPEYSSYFERQLNKHNITVRHSRLGRPNDNAHIERFNRTIQEECLGSRIDYKTTTTQIQNKITEYLDYYNNDRVHLGIQLRTPVQMLQRF